MSPLTCEPGCILLVGARTGCAVEIRRQLGDAFAVEAAPVRAALASEGVHRCGAILLDARALAEARESVASALDRLMAADGVPRVVLLVEKGEPDAARLALEAGAWDVLPLDAEAKEICERLREAARLARLEREGGASPGPAASIPEGDPPPGATPLVAGCASMKRVLTLVRRLATSDVPVLIAGESGTGKELVALAIHERSGRARGPFVPLDCAAIPENLLESEFFGHEKGAFTGATHTRVGRIERAHGGTLFLDEIGDLALPLQVKLLRFLEDHRIQRVGGDTSIPVDVRIVAATHRDLEDDVRQGRFREDLYYRINVFTLELPPLRERRADVLALAKAVLDAEPAPGGRKPRGFAPEAVAALARAELPGNVRELQNRVRRAVVVAEEELITPEDLGLPPLDAEAERRTLAEVRAEADVDAIRDALRSTGGNKSEAARLLGVSRTQLYEIMDRHGIRGDTIPGLD